MTSIERTVGRHRRLANADDSDDENTSNNIKLTVAKASELCPKEYRLIATNAGYTSLNDLSSLSSLDYIDLTGNQLTSTEGLESNFRLKTLILRNNKLTDINPILRLSNIRILNIAENSINTTEWLMRASFASELLAFVASGNQISYLEGFSALHRIETLVIGNNQLEDISSIARLTTLKKLSASNNAIREIPASFSSLTNLSELRLAHNRISSTSEEVLGKMSSLKILDIGHNRIMSFESLSGMPLSLTNINVKGNPACDKLKDIAEYLRGICPQLEVINSKRLIGGRRKIRVNRLRVAVGFQPEPERKFARPPPEYYVKKLNDSDYEKVIDRGDDNVRKSVASKRKQSEDPSSASLPQKTNKKRLRQEVTADKRAKHEPTSSGGEDEQVISPDDFMNSARTKTSAPENVAMKERHQQTGTSASKGKKNKSIAIWKESKNPGGLVEDGFGQGQESQW